MAFLLVRFKNFYYYILEEIVSFKLKRCLSKWKVGVIMKQLLVMNLFLKVYFKGVAIFQSTHMVLKKFLRLAISIFCAHIWHLIDG